MQIPSPKQEALEAIQRLPDNVNLDEIVYRLYVIGRVHQGLQEIDKGVGLLSSDELRREIEQW
jgi:hypothetical protein